MPTIRYRTIHRLAAGLAIGFIALVWAPTIRAQQNPDTLTVDRAVDVALERDGFEAAQSAKLERLNGEQMSARAFPNPTFSFDREQQWQDDTAVAEDFFVLEQTLPIWGTRALRAEAAAARRQAAASDNRAERLDRRLEVRRAFYATLRARTKLDHARQFRDQVRTTVEILETRQQADEASEYAVARLQQTLIETESTIADARASLVEARGRLAGLIGRSPTPLKAWSVEGDLLQADLPNLETLMQRLDDRPQLAKLRAEARAYSKQRRALGRSLVPAPAIRGGYKRADDPVGGSLNGFLVGVSLEVPLLSQKTGQRRAAAARRSRLQAIAEMRRHQLAADLRSAYRAAEMRLEAAKTYRKRAVPSANDLLERARQRQKAGVGSLFDLVDAHRSVYDTNIRATDRAWKARSAIIEVQRHAGGFP